LTTWYAEAARSARRSGPALPPGAAATIKKTFPEAKIREVEREREGILLYEVELLHNGKEVQIAADGTVIGQKVEDEDDDD